MNPNECFDQWHDQLPFYVAGTLPEPERLALDEHLRGCAACRAEVKAWQLIAEAVRADAIARVAPHELPP
jgi:anti-sigma factor RsiW